MFGQSNADLWTGNQNSRAGFFLSRCRGGEAPGKYLSLCEHRLNQIECWFSILSRSALQGASSINVRTLVEAIEAFIGNWNQTAAPFEWTKEEAHQQRLKYSYAELCN